MSVAQQHVLACKLRQERHVNISLLTELRTQKEPQATNIPSLAGLPKQLLKFKITTCKVAALKGHPRSHTKRHQRNTNNPGAFLVPFRVTSWINPVCFSASVPRSNFRAS